MEKVIHNIPPVFDKHSKILILGSFPSVKSRENGFFYGHPRNRFWQVLAILFNEREPITVEEKRTLLIRHNIALWDVLASCEIKGSADSTIQNAVANDIDFILNKSEVKRIFVNGKTAEKYYNRYIFPTNGIKPIQLSSTSPANASKSLRQLVEEWKIIL